MAQEENKHSLEAKFAAAVKVVQSLPAEGPFQPSDNMMLMFYSYNKQATLGPCNIPRPTSFWDTHGKTKWDAWSSLGNMSKEEAMKNYVEDIQLILETIPISDEVSDLVQKLGNFYTHIDREGEDDEENEVDTRPFTRPFAQYADDLIKPFQKPAMEGYGDLWEDIQNLQESDKNSSVHGISVSGEEAEGSEEDNEIERKEECSDWKSEEENEDEEDCEDEEEEEEEDEKDLNCDPRLNKSWRSNTRGSSSSMEPSMSSFTISSLTSEMEELELACFLEPNHSDVAPDKNHRSTDSDTDEFCDSMEHLAMEEGLSRSKSVSPESGAASVRPKALCFKSNAALNGGGKGPQSLKVTCSSQQCASREATSSRVSQSSRPVSAARGNVNEQIATALLRLQHDMATVLHRLHTLEALTLSQSRSSSPRQEDSLLLAKKFMSPSWWPFDLCPLSVVLTALWPLIAHWLVHVYLQWKRRKNP